MPTAYEPHQILDKQELSLFQLSQAEQQLGALPVKERRRLLQKARNLRDRARTKYVKQVAHTRMLTGSKRGYGGAANERSRAKAALLTQAVQSLQQL